MSQETQRHEITRKKVVLQLPGMNDVKVRQDVEYKTTESGAHQLDLYYPPDAQSEARLPAVVFVSGYPDPGFQKMLGCKLKEMESYISWGELTATSGMVAVTYTNTEPANDLDELLQFIRQSAAALGIDENRIGVWACSGNAPNALAALMQNVRDYLKCAVLCYGLMLDLDGSNNVAEAAKMWGFVNPGAGKSVADLPLQLPLLIVRAGQDSSQINETIDRFLSAAVARNLPVTFFNYPTAPHAFDVMDDSETSREIIRQILSFMQFHLK
jgi:acetyl esterase/lipase